jgi:hypothetical protein
VLYALLDSGSGFVNSKTKLALLDTLGFFGIGVVEFSSSREVGLGSTWDSDIFLHYKKKLTGNGPRGPENCNR